MDTKTKCAKCGNPDCDLDDHFCFNCGANLINYCSNEDCIVNDADTPGLPRNYCFCPVCGSQTKYMVNGYISPKEFSL